MFIVKMNNVKLIDILHTHTNTKDASASSGNNQNGALREENQSLREESRTAVAERQKAEKVATEAAKNLGMFHPAATTTCVVVTHAMMSIPQP